MLPSINKIKTRDFRGVSLHKTNKTLQGALFRVILDQIKDHQGGTPRCAVIVSKKLAKTAVARNKIRRQVYGALEKILRKLPQGLIYIYPKKALMDDREIMEDLENLLCLKK